MSYYSVYICRRGRTTGGHNAGVILKGVGMRGGAGACLRDGGRLVLVAVVRFGAGFGSDAIIWFRRGKPRMRRSPGQNIETG